MGIAHVFPRVSMDRPSLKSEAGNDFKKARSMVRKFFPEKTSIPDSPVFTRRDSGFIC
jgi:hypothetical protein